MPLEGTQELDDLARAFNAMSAQLSLARDAERAVLLSVSHDLHPGLARPRAREAGVGVRIEGDPAPASADHGRVLQVLSNLLENAIRVSPAGGEVTLSAAPGELRVADRGAGIPAADLPHAFERFHLRAHAGGGSSEGAGLGLAIVRELTEAMGGTAAVENRPDGGAQFTVRLPFKA